MVQAENHLTVMRCHSQTQILSGRIFYKHKDLIHYRKITEYGKVSYFASKNHKNMALMKMN